MSAGRQELLESVFRQADLLCRADPWKSLPAPWALKLQVSSTRRPAPCTHVVVFSSGEKGRVVVVYATEADYANNPLDTSKQTLLRFVPWSQVPKRDKALLKAASPDFHPSAQPTCPQFATQGADLVWFEAACAGLTHFVSFASSQQQQGTALLFRVSAPYPAHVAASSKELYRPLEHPCHQLLKIPTTRAPVEAVVDIAVLPTQTALQHALLQDKTAQPARATDSSPQTSGTAQPMCKQCGAAGSTDKALSRCAACQLVSYCSRECQKVDWPQHKAACKPHKKKQAASAASADST
eukprot:g20361.t1